jgi:SAM-dependent methyltransferase
MSENVVYSQLERPWLYRLSQRLLGLGGDDCVTKKIAEVMQRMSPARRVLDVGCGPVSRLWRLGVQPVGLDFSPSYAQATRRAGSLSLIGSAPELPLASDVFDAVWSFGLLHHLALDEARRAVREMVRVCRAGGYVAIFDGVLPHAFVNHPFAWMIRRLDRGAHFRNEIAFRQLLESSGWNLERFCYAKTGLEGLLCTLVKGE